MPSSVPTVPPAQKAWALGEVGMLSQRKIHYLQVSTNKPLMLVIANCLQHILRRFILISRESKGYRGKLVDGVKQDTFQRSLAAVTE